MSVEAPAFPYVLCSKCKFQPLHLTPDVHYCQRCLRGWSTREYDSKQYDEDYAQDLMIADGEDWTVRIDLHRIGSFSGR